MKTTVSDLNDVPETLRGEYEQRGDTFVLKLDGDHPELASRSELTAANSKVVEFRDKNVALLSHAARISGQTEVEDLTGIEAALRKFDGVDPDEYATLKERASQLEKRGVKKADDVAAIAKEQVEAAMAPLREQLETEQSLRIAAQKEADSSKLSELISGAALKAGAHRAALDFLVTEAGRVFSVEDSKLSTGEYSTRSPGNPLGIDEWLQGAVKDFAFAFADSAGGGADTATSGSGSNSAGAKELRNPDPFELGRHIDDIVDGKLIPVND